MIVNRSTPLSLCQASRSSRPGFTMLEVLITMGIFAVGFVAVAAIFPTAILLQKKTVEDVVAQQVARNAQAVLEARGITAGAAITADLWLQLDEAESGTTWDTDQRVHPLPSDVLTNHPAAPAIGTPPGQQWLLPDRSYPSSSSPVEARKVFWVPLVRDPTAVAGVNAGEVIVYAFIIQRSTDGRYPRPDLTEANWVNFYDGYLDTGAVGLDAGDTWLVPGVTRQTVTVSTSDLTRFDFTNTWIWGGNTFLKVNTGDQILDCYGGIYTVQDADATGVKIAGIINPNLDTSAFPDEIWFAHPDADGRQRPTKRILTLTKAVK